MVNASVATLTKAHLTTIIVFRAGLAVITVSTIASIYVLAGAGHAILSRLEKTRLKKPKTTD